jgi:hypothetical protein
LKKARKFSARYVCIAVVGADDAAVDADPLRVFRMVVGDEDVARVHVGVEEAVAEHLGEEDLERPARPAA